VQVPSCWYNCHKLFYVPVVLVSVCMYVCVCGLICLIACSILTLYNFDSFCNIGP